MSIHNCSIWGNMCCTEKKDVFLHVIFSNTKHLRKVTNIVPMKIMQGNHLITVKSQNIKPE